MSVRHRRQATTFLTHTKANAHGKHSFSQWKGKTYDNQTGRLERKRDSMALYCALITCTFVYTHSSALDTRTVTEN